MAKKTRTKTRTKTRPKTLAELRSDPLNPRTIDDGAAAGLGTSLEQFGDISGICWNRRTGELVSGHQRVSKLKEKHGGDLAIEYSGRGEWGAIRTPDGNAYQVRVVDWSREKQRAANLAANNEAIQGTWTEALQLRLIETEQYDGDLYSALLLTELEADQPDPDDDDDDQANAAADDDGKRADLAALAKKWKTKSGQVWRVTGQAEHVITCGDCTHMETIARVTGDLDFQAQAVMILSDPPYCSGGNQEAGKSAGSVGRRGKHRVARDQLSTRGYLALLRSMLERLSGTGVAYLFTDWRMWVHLFDLVESQGFGVKNMIVWDKGHAGMGRGWRSQHELICCATKVAVPFDGTKALGNVRPHSRTRNYWHDTEKPVDLLAEIIDVTDACDVVVDPFCGSGGVLLAADRHGRPARLVELEPAIMAAALERAELAGMRCELIDQANPKPKRKATRKK